MPTDSAPRVPEHHDALLTQHLHDFLGDIEPAALTLLRERLTWVAVAGGQTLMEQGEPGDSMYLSISGRLRAYVNDEDGVPRMVREMGRGQVIGEMSLYTDEPRSASVVAIRDSVLVRLEKAHFAELLASSSQVSMSLTRQIIRRLQTQHERNPVPLPVTISLLAVSDGAGPARLCRQAGRESGEQGPRDRGRLRRPGRDAERARCRQRQRVRRGTEPAHLAAARPHRGRTRVRALAR